MEQHVNGGWFSVPHYILEDARFIDLPLSVQMFFIHLCKLKNRLGDRFYHSVPTLMKETGLTDRTIHKAKKLLVKYEWVKIERGANKVKGLRKADVFMFKWS